MSLAAALLFVVVVAAAPPTLKPPPSFPPPTTAAPDGCVFESHPAADLGLPTSVVGDTVSLRWCPGKPLPPPLLFAAVRTLQGFPQRPYIGPVPDLAGDLCLTPQPDDDDRDEPPLVWCRRAQRWEVHGTINLRPFSVLSDTAVDVDAAVGAFVDFSVGALPLSGIEFQNVVLRARRGKTGVVDYAVTHVTGDLQLPGFAPLHVDADVGHYNPGDGDHATFPVPFPAALDDVPFPKTRFALSNARVEYVGSVRRGGWRVFVDVDGGTVAAAPFGTYTFAGREMQLRFRDDDHVALQGCMEATPGPLEHGGVRWTTPVVFVCNGQRDVEVGVRGAAAIPGLAPQVPVMARRSGDRVVFTIDNDGWPLVVGGHPLSGLKLVNERGVLQAEAQIVVERDTWIVWGPVPPTGPWRWQLRRQGDTAPLADSGFSRDARGGFVLVVNGAVVAPPPVRAVTK